MPDDVAGVQEAEMGEEDEGRRQEMVTISSSLPQAGTETGNERADDKSERRWQRRWRATKAKAAAAAKPKAAVVCVKRKAAEKPKMKPAAKPVQTFAKATPCEEGCPCEAEDGSRPRHR
ncbi:hypothetical protein NL676_036043 [Syzygium grande]|nr:hypothetical protein NL676_036043 [Syzygium grande]